MDTDIVFPNRLGVLTRISCSPSTTLVCAAAAWRLHCDCGTCGVASQPLSSSSLECARAKAPGPSRLKKMRAQLLRYSSWNMRWWKERSHPLLSSACSPRQVYDAWQSPSSAAPRRIAPRICTIAPLRKQVPSCQRLRTSSPRRQALMRRIPCICVATAIPCRCLAMAVMGPLLLTLCAACSASARLSKASNSRSSDTRDIPHLLRGAVYIPPALMPPHACRHTTYRPSGRRRGAVQARQNPRPPPLPRPTDVRRSARACCAPRRPRVHPAPPARPARCATTCCDA